MDRDLPVSVWPEWKIIEKIGEGSFGKVYKAQRMERDKAFYSAIKIISIPSNQSELKSVQSEIGEDQSVREYFQNLVEECIQEVSTMEYFRGNSHVVAVEDYKVVEYLDTIGWDIYIRMEYVTSFLEYCSGKQMNETEVIQLGIDLCKALEYCQKLNIIHRDIKPENIFISRFGEFKLGDFGIARELERSMSTLSKKGTYSYMAPEMYKGEKYDSRVDIYSLGIMLYKLRNRNRLPFLNLEKQLITYRDKENALTRRMSGEQLPAPADAGEELSQVILKACAYKSEDRYADAAEFGRALEDLKYHKSVQNKPISQEQAQVKQPQPEKRQKPVRTAEAQQQARPKGAQQLGTRTPQPKQPPASKQGQPARSTRSAQTGQARQPQPVSQPKHKEAAKRTPPEEQRQTVSANHKKKKKQSGMKPLVAAVIIMAIAVVIVTAVFINLLLQDNGTDTDTGQPAGIADVLGGDNADESEMEGLAEDLSTIRDHATTIVNELETYHWIGTERDGKISYLNKDGKIRKVLIYPNLSVDGVYEEYYYWDDELFFAYIWQDSSINSDLKDGEVRANYYYYKNGEMIRWIDESNICHDYETDNEEYNILGKKYWERSEEYTAEFVKAGEEVENAVSD